MELKHKYEITFKQGYHLGFRIAMVKQMRGLSHIYRKHNDTEMANFYWDQAKQWLGFVFIILETVDCGNSNNNGFNKLHIGKK